MLLIDGARVAAGLGALPANAGLAPSDRATPAQSITVSVMKKKRRPITG